MGWTYTHRAKGMSDADFISADLGEHYSIVESASYERRVFYAAVRDNRDGTVSGLVVLMHWAPRDYHNFGTKWIGEEAGPYESFAPARVLDALTPTDVTYATEWRQRCRANLDRPRVSVGMTIVLDEPVSYADGHDRQRFTLVKGSVFRADDGALVRLPRWRERRYTIATATA